MGNLHSAAASGAPYGARAGKRRNQYVRQSLSDLSPPSEESCSQPSSTEPRAHSFTPYPRSLNPRFHPPSARPKSNNAISGRLRRELSKLLFAFLPPTDSRASSHHYLWGLRARHTACPPHVWGHMHPGSHGRRLEEGKSRWCKEAGSAVDTRSYDVIVPLTHLRGAATRDDGPRAAFYVVNICIPPRRGRKDRFRTFPSLGNRGRTNGDFIASTGNRLSYL